MDLIKKFEETYKVGDILESRNKETLKIVSLQLGKEVFAAEVLNVNHYNYAKGYIHNTWLKGYLHWKKINYYNTPLHKLLNPGLYDD